MSQEGEGTSRQVMLAGSMQAFNRDQEPQTRVPLADREFLSNKGAEAAEECETENALLPLRPSVEEEGIHTPRFT
jgi:hypothetical protein